MGLIERNFRLTNEPGGLGLSCSEAGLSLAGVPLLHKSAAGFSARPASEIELLLEAAYGGGVAVADLLFRFDAVAGALNRGELASAMISAVMTRLPELNWDAAARLANIEQRLRKYNSQEPRDWRGRWTDDAGADFAGRDKLPRGSAAFGDASRDQVPQPVSTSSSSQDGADDDQDDDDDGGLPADASPLERKYDELPLVPFARQVIQFGDDLGRKRQDLNQDERQDALAEYNFLQNRLTFWLGYEPKPAEAQANLISAAQALYEGAVNGGLVPVGGKYGDIPQSMMVVAAGAIALDDSQPGAPLRLPRTGVQIEPEPVVAPEARRLWETVDNADIGINWDAGIQDKGFPWERYNAAQNPEIERLPPGSKTFDAKDLTWSEAISEKVLDPLTYSYATTPRRVYNRVKTYVDAAAGYRKPRAGFDLKPEEIERKSIKLAVRDYFSAKQTQYLYRALSYGRSRGVRVVITRVK